MLDRRSLLKTAVVPFVFKNHRPQIGWWYEWVQLAWIQISKEKPVPLCLDDAARVFPPDFLVVARLDYNPAVGNMSYEFFDQKPPEKPVWFTPDYLAIQDHGRIAALFLPQEG